MNNLIPSVFTKTTSVWVSENFQNIILDRYIKTGRDNIGSVDSSDLQDIGAHKAQELVFQDADIFLEDLAILIENQIRGQEGKLLNDSSADYFFVLGKDGKHYSILVRWEQAQKLWRCGAYLQEELKMPNIRIFYSK